MRLIMARETTTDVKMEVRMPKQCTTAKPRTGPEPKINNAMPDELFDQSRHRRADARRIASALEVIGNLTGRPAELREWYPRFSSVDEVPTLRRCER